MKKKGRFLKISLITITVLALLTAIHVILIVDTSPVDNGNIELTRVDFNSKIDQSVAVPIQTTISKLPGVTQTVLNNQDGNIVVGFDNNKTNIQSIYEAIELKYPKMSTIFIPTEEDLASSCPVMNRNSATFRVVSTIKNIF